MAYVFNFFISIRIYAAFSYLSYIYILFYLIYNRSSLILLEKYYFITLNFVFLFFDIIYNFILIYNTTNYGDKDSNL